MSTLRLPSAVYDNNLGEFLTRLGSMDRGPAGVVTVDFQDVRFYMPGALVALLAAIHRWGLAKREVEFINCETAPAFRYLQRMDFLEKCGLRLPEAFTRHQEQGRFVTLRRIDQGTARNVGPLCQEIAACIFPKQAEMSDPARTGPHDILEYVASELINNIIQHARGPGYVAVQRFPQKGLVALGIADCGIGIRRSFEDNQPAFWDPGMSHLDAVRTALQPRASSKAHLSGGWGTGRQNEGVGLSMLKEIAAGAEGVFTLASGNGYYQENKLLALPVPIETDLLEHFPGTLCSVVLTKQKLGNHQQILLEAKRRLGLLQQTGPLDKFFT